MTAEVAAELSQKAILIVLTIGAPLLLAGLLTSMVVGLLQAITQIQDQSLVFIPRLIVVSLVLLVLLPWGLTRLTEYASDLIRGIPGTI